MYLTKKLLKYAREREQVTDKERPVRIIPDSSKDTV